MFCPKCGTVLDDSAFFCINCGTPLNGEQPRYEQTNPQPSATDPGKDMGLISLILSIASFLVPSGILLPAAGAILGYIARNKSQKAGFKNEFAFIGMVIGIVKCGIAILTTIASVAFMLLYFFAFFGFTMTSI